MTTQNQSDNPILSVKNVTKYFGNYPASNDISFDVKKGIIFGLLGPNGAGKTTLIRMINNIYVPDEGEITLLGEKVSSATQNKIAYLPEERGLYKKQKVIDQLIYFGQLKGLDRTTAKRSAEKWLLRLGAPDWLNKKIQDLSKGMAQKVQFISTVLHDPQFLILDEPFSGFDPINSELLKDVVLELKEEGKTIILSTHVMHQVEQLCDDICLINKGRAVLKGNVRDIKNSFGRDTLLLEFEGDDSFLNELEGMKVVNKTSSRSEIHIENDDIDTTSLINDINSKVKLYKFELVEPSIHHIFVNTVKGDGASNE